MATPEQVLAEVQRRYGDQPAQERYVEIYESEDPRLRDAFAYMHSQLDSLLGFMNEKRLRGGHYNADPSRDLIDLIRDIGILKGQLRRVGVTVTLDSRYEQTLERCQRFLVGSGGSAIPDDFEHFELIEFDPIFQSSLSTVLQKEHVPLQLKMIGGGSYANVYRFQDDFYKTTFALKKAKPNLDEGELRRFKAEYDVLKSINFPYILTVYGYDEAGPSYTMEFCEFTLEKFMNKHNSKLKRGQRMRMVQQFLWALRYLSSRRILHRDLSYTNVLVSDHEFDMMTVKLSDFGLHKTEESTFTHTGSDMKGSLRDPQATSFKDFSLVNEIHAVGYVLAYILTGKKGVPGNPGPVRDIILKCVHPDTTQRYDSIEQIINDVSNLNRPSSATNPG
ncbi:protein kinase family protein [Arthrobacter sp. MDT3-44]